MQEVLRLPQVFAPSFKSGSSHPTKATSALELDLDLKVEERSEKLNNGETVGQRQEGSILAFTTPYTPCNLVYAGRKYCSELPARASLLSATS